MMRTNGERLLCVSILCSVSLSAKAEPPTQLLAEQDPGTRLEALVRRAATSAEITTDDTARSSFVAQYERLPLNARKALLEVPPEAIEEALSAYFGAKKKKLGLEELTATDIADLDLRYLRYEAALLSSFRDAMFELDQSADSFLRKSYRALPDNAKSQLDTASFATVAGGLGRYLAAKRRFGDQEPVPKELAADFDWAYFHDDSLNFAIVQFESFGAGQINSVSTGKFVKKTKINFNGGEFLTLTVPVYGDSLSFSGQIGGFRRKWSARGVDAEQGIAFYTAAFGASQGATIIINSEPEKAAVFFDAKDVKVKTNDKVIKDEGTYELRLKLPGYVDWYEEITVEAGETKVINASLTPMLGSTLTINSIPPGANISVDGEETAARTNAVLVLDPAEYTVLITLVGYKDWQRSVTLEAGKRANLSANLEAKESSEGDES